MNIAIVVASMNRAEEIGQLLASLARQTVPAARIVLSVVSPSDLPADLPPGVEIVMGPAGLTMQRNRGLDLVLPSCDIVAFFDDDFIPHAMPFPAWQACSPPIRMWSAPPGWCFRMA